MFSASQFLTADSDALQLEILHGLGETAQLIWLEAARLLGGKHDVVRYFLQRVVQIATQLEANGFPQRTMSLFAVKSANWQIFGERWQGGQRAIFGRI